jgi:hypothetical protein
MATLYTIALTNDAQEFSIILNQVTYTITIQYNENQGWQMNIADINGDPIVSNIPFITGSDLLAPFAYMNFGFGVFVLTDGSDAVPTYDNLGTNSNIYFAM